MSLKSAPARSSPPPVEIRSTPSPDWDAFVDAVPGGTFCQLGGWHQVLHGYMGHECHYLEVREPDGELAGVLPLVRVKSRLFGDFLVSMPFLSYGGPVGTPSACIRLSIAAWELAGTLGTRLLELRTRHEIESPLELSPRKLLVLLPLPKDPEILWKEGFRSKLRTKIRRAEKEGFEYRTGPALIDDFYSVFSRNMRDLGTPVLPHRFFELLPETFGERVLVASLRHEGKPVAAACGFFHGEEFEVTWSSALRELNRLNPNTLLYWHLMREVIARGGRTFNFGRSTPESSTHDFKLSWGGHDVPLPWLHYSPSGVTKPPTPDESKFALAIRVWQRLPVPLTRIAGPLISPYIP